MLLQPRKRPATAKSKRARHPLPDTSTTKRGRGRPMKKESQLKPPHVVRMQQARLLLARQKLDLERPSSRSRLSTIESLPVELIQQIFFYALEINLPRASTHLARVLSKPSIYAALILFAYFNADESQPVEQHLFLPAKYRYIDSVERTRLQEGILACRWCTVDMLKEHMPVLSRLVMVQAWHRERQRILELPKSASFDQFGVAEGQEYFQPVAALPNDINDRQALEKHFFARSDIPCFDCFSSLRPSSQPHKCGIGPVGQNGFLPRVIEWEFHNETKANHPPRQVKQPTYGTAILDVRCLPDHILQGRPEWTEPQIEMVMLLRQSMRFLAGDRIPIRMSAAALFDGMASAIRTQNTTALLVLLELHFAICSDPDRGGAAATYPLPLEMFHLACHQAQPHASRIMALLLRGGIASVPSEDYDLTSWAVRNRDDDVARFLLRHMEGAHGDYGLAHGQSLFVNGITHDRVNSDIVPLGHVDFTFEIGYISHGSTHGTQSNGHLIIAG